MGNHDEALFHDASDFNPHARGAIEYTRGRMKPRWYSSSDRRQRWNWLRGLPLAHTEGRFLFVHGSPRDPVREYVLSTDGFLNPDKLRQIFASFEGIAVGGHTHHPGVHDEELRFHGMNGSDSVTFEFEDDAKYFVNVGSVGQPRDGDPRACWVLAREDGSFSFRRVPYDIRATQQKIKAVGLPDVLAEKVAAGDDLTELEGIGAGIATKIEEIVKLGGAATADTNIGRPMSAISGMSISPRSHAIVCSTCSS